MGLHDRLVRDFAPMQVPMSTSVLIRIRISTGRTVPILVAILIIKEAILNLNWLARTISVNTIGVKGRVPSSSALRLNNQLRVWQLSC